TKVYLWDVQTGQAWLPPWDVGAALSAVTFSPDGKLLATHSVTGVARLWDVATGRPTSPPLNHEERRFEGHAPNHYPFSAAFHPAGPLFARGGFDGTVRLWKTPGAALSATS